MREYKHVWVDPEFTEIEKWFVSNRHEEKTIGFGHDESVDIRFYGLDPWVVGNAKSNAKKYTNQAIGSLRWDNVLDGNLEQIKELRDAGSLDKILGDSKNYNTVLGYFGADAMCVRCAIQDLKEKAEKHIWKGNRNEMSLERGAFALVDVYKQYFLKDLEQDNARYYLGYQPSEEDIEVACELLKEAVVIEFERWREKEKEKHDQRQKELRGESRDENEIEGEVLDQLEIGADNIFVMEANAKNEWSLNALVVSGEDGFYVPRARKGTLLRFSEKELSSPVYRRKILRQVFGVHYDINLDGEMGLEQIDLHDPFNTIDNTIFAKKKLLNSPATKDVNESVAFSGRMMANISQLSELLGQASILPHTEGSLTSEQIFQIAQLIEGENANSIDRVF
ncbi:MAG: hypothetical protein FWE31_00160 [Firmicutes bacterium]|nr:hypothetical protein [Bacillota bacterium]